MDSHAKPADRPAVPLPSPAAPALFKTMPELPEVETTRRGVAPHVVGRRVEGVHVYDGRLRWPVPSTLGSVLAGQTITAVDRRSKYLLFRTAPGSLLVHLGMTGHLAVRRTSGTSPAELPRERHDHVDIVLEGGIYLRYRDPRRFGAMLWLPAGEGAHPLLAGLGPEPFDAAFDGGYLHQATRGRRVAIKVALMDNHLVTGVGNIYANEALFRAGIRPTLPAGRLSLARAERLVGTVREVLAEAIAKGGSTLRDYVDADGRAGEFQLHYAVYGRAGKACPACGQTIRIRRLGQRSSFFCPACQR